MTRPKLQTTLLLFSLLVFSSILLGEMAIYFLKMNQLVYKDLSEQLTLKQMEEFFDTKERWAWVSHLIIPFLLFLKITVIAWVLGIGGFFNEVSLSHRSYFRIVLMSEYIFLIPALSKIAWFYFFETDFTYEQVQEFVPFSLQSIMDTSSIPNWALYPLQLCSLFELVYWFILAVSIDRATRGNMGIKVVSTGYAPALFVWVAFIMFLTLNLSV
jgi:hypothetical protein